MPNFAVDANLTYRNQTYQHRQGQPYRLCQGYKKRFLPLVNPSHADLSAHDSVKANNRHGVSLVAFVRTDVLTTLEPLKTVVRETLPEGTYNFNEPGLTHFTIRGYGDPKDLALNNLPNEVSAALMGFPAARVQIRGVWLPDFLMGRVFLRVYPEVGAATEENKISEMIQKVGGRDWGTYPIGFVQFRRDLTISETDSLLAALKDFNEQVFAKEARIDSLLLVQHSNDLLMDHAVLREIHLSR